MDTGRTWALLVAAAAAVAVAVVVAGCSSDRKVTPPAPTTTTVSVQERAVLACAKAVPTGLVNAKATTVGTIHALGDGRPDSHPYWFVLANLPDDQFAAWCWHRLAPQHFELLVVGPSGQVVKTGQGLQSDGPPVPGPLVFF